MNPLRKINYLRTFEAKEIKDEERWTILLGKEISKAISLLKEAKPADSVSESIQKMEAAIVLLGNYRQLCSGIITDVGIISRLLKTRVVIIEEGEIRLLARQVMAELAQVQMDLTSSIGGLDSIFKSRKYSFSEKAGMLKRTIESSTSKAIKELTDALRRLSLAFKIEKRTIKEV